MSAAGPTMRLAEAASRPAPVSPRGRTILRHALLDLGGVTIAGAATSQARIVTDALLGGGGNGATLLGRTERLPLVDAALANGTAAHALDYDDVNMAIPGHPAAVILPALLAAAEGEPHPVPGERLLAAYGAGYDVMCRLGAWLGVEHYDRGFHATATLGTLGAAAACANLFRLSPKATGHALGVAATQAAGLKLMFGSMTKPFNAGRAASNGLLAAQLARAGLESRLDAVEHPQGFAALYAAAPDFSADAGATADDYIAGNLFKYHAACYLVHAAIDAVREIRRAAPFALQDVSAVVVRGDRSLDSVCNILEPRTPNEAKFSLRAAVALALAGRDTARIESFDGFAEDADAGAAMALTRIELQDGWSKNVCEVSVTLSDGRTYGGRCDSSVPDADLDAAGRRLEAKFRALVAPLAGASRADDLVGGISAIEADGDVRRLIARFALGGES